MQLWDKILQAAILGSERTRFEPAVEEALRQYGIDPEDPMPQVILSAAATWHQVRKLQLSHSAYDKPLPEPAVEEEEAQTLPSSHLSILQRILSGAGPYRKILPEFVQIMNERQWILPPEFLPELLNDSLQEADLWRSIRPLLGERATWLIRQRPAWHALQPQVDPADWPAADSRERLLIINRLRNEAPQAAIPLLETTWEELDHRQKVAYLQLLESGLNPADEAFLERSREDSRKEVRRKATDLLLTLPGSRLLGTLFEHLHPLFQTTQKGKTLQVVLPEAIPEAAILEGLLTGKKKSKNKSLKITWLTESVARIPAAYWQKQFDWTPSQLVDRFRNSNHPPDLLSALGQAALRFGDVALATALIRTMVLHRIPFPDDMDWQSVSRWLTATDLQVITHEYFDEYEGLLEEKMPLTKILELGAHPWSERMAQRIIQDLKQWMTESKTFLWNLWHYKQLLEVAGYHSPIELFDTFNADWPMHSPVWNQWAPDIDRMLRIMRFRKSMYQKKN